MPGRRVVDPAAGDDQVDSVRDDGAMVEGQGSGIEYPGAGPANAIGGSRGDESCREREGAGIVNPRSVRPRAIAGEDAALQGSGSGVVDPAAIAGPFVIVDRAVGKRQALWSWGASYPLSRVLRDPSGDAEGPHSRDHSWARREVDEAAREKLDRLRGRILARMQVPHPRPGDSFYQRVRIDPRVRRC